MAPSVDGRIVTTRWKVPPTLYSEYERTAHSFRASAWMIGRISMEPYAGKAKVPRRKTAQPIPRTDFIARRDAESYAVALDPSGKLTWRSSSIDEEHVISVLTERVPDDYLAFLRTKGVSYLFAGKKEVDLDKALQKLRREFGIQRLLLEGGGKINGAFLAAGLIDELSVLLVPLADGGIGIPSLFDAPEGRGHARPLKLISVEKRPGDLLWLRYRVKR
jgi:riboflavin biosynthesis pyrimidine reductase